VVFVNDTSAGVEVGQYRSNANIDGRGGSGGAAAPVLGWTLETGKASTMMRSEGSGERNGFARDTRFSVRALPDGGPQFFDLPALGSYIVRFTGSGSSALTIAIEEWSGPVQRDAQDRQVREILDRPRAFEAGR
jgi:hypothetical protein